MYSLFLTIIIVHTERFAVIMDGTVHIGDVGALEIVTTEEDEECERDVGQFQEIVINATKDETAHSVAIGIEEVTEYVDQERRVAEEEMIEGSVTVEHDYARKDIKGHYTAESRVAESILTVASEDGHTELNVEGEDKAVEGEIERVLTIAEGNEAQRFGETECSLLDREVDIGAGAGISGLERCDISNHGSTGLSTEEGVEVELNASELKEGKADVKLVDTDLSIDPELEIGKIFYNESEVVNFIMNYMDKKKCVFVVMNNNTTKGSGGVSFCK